MWLPIHTNPPGTWNNVGNPLLGLHNLNLEAMSLLSAVKQANKADDIKLETVDTKLLTLTGVINGKYGPFRQFSCAEGTFNIDEKNVTNSRLFKPSCDATITVKQYTNSTGEEKTVIAGLTIHIGNGVLGVAL